jgi:hypothetical protein
LLVDANVCSGELGFAFLKFGVLTRKDLAMALLNANPSRVFASLRLCVYLTLDF